ncbi:alpha/beta hydrolase [Actinocorallia sp. A-T 12471]|uniref:alpha/beta hydrolase family protein n=1 Tax=Actinocorallia sp. A-T 12471 TaxID=3089813 RepID=UPI0029CC20CB|nr:alpha/beta hydrolase [Actinocorallia sp. A-T 12471]MDX6743305.1 alpha/beta fold hydrolase [Actinocorallia sp. A-T 12471]
MRLFENPLLQLFAARALAMIPRGGAEYGECQAAAADIVEGDDASWYRSWTTLGDTVAEWAAVSDDKGHYLSASDAWLKAATYYRTAYYPLYGTPVDPRLVLGFRREEESFRRFAELRKLREVEVPFDGVKLRGYLCPAQGPEEAERRPVVVSVGGVGTNLHERWGMHGLPAVRRGYHCLLLDGPGQGRGLIELGLPMRPDWEYVMTPVLADLRRRPEVDPDRIALVGVGFGAFLAARTAAAFPEVAALVTDPGPWDLGAEPPDDDAFADPVMRWLYQRAGMWAHGFHDLDAYVEDLARYRLTEIVGDIGCPTFVTAAEADLFSHRAARFYQALECQKTFTVFTRAEGAAGPLELWNRSRLDQRVYDWLDETLHHYPGMLGPGAYC